MRSSTIESPDSFGKPTDNGQYQPMDRVNRLLAMLFESFPEVTIGTLNRRMQFSALGGQLFSASGLLGRDNESIHTCVQFFPQADPQYEKFIAKAFEGEPISHEVRIGNLRYHVRAIPVKEPENKIDEVLCVIQNITNAKQLEEGLLEALDREKELGELKSRFVTMASHEFRTPLTAILASTFLLETYTGEDYNREKLLHTRRIKRSVNNLTNILNEFLSLEKLEANKVSIVQSEINIPEYIQDDLMDEMDLIKKQGQTIAYQHQGESVFQTDHHVLWSILTNLISNALKYSKPEATVNVTSVVEDGRLHIKVEDNGIGIPADEQKSIFGRFFRARNATNIEGTGLGLHITQKYVHLLGGTIEFESLLDQGTTFNVALPAVAAPARTSNEIFNQPI